MEPGVLCFLVTVIPVTVGIFVIYAQQKYKNKIKNNIEESLKYLQVNSFVINKRLAYNDILLCVDDVNRKWAVSTMQLPVSIYDYSDIIDYEIFMNGNKISGGMGTAAIGGLLAGPTGAIIGSNASKTQTFDTIQVRIKMDNLQMTEIVLDLLKHDLNKESKLIQNMALEKAKEFEATLLYIVNHSK